MFSFSDILFRSLRSIFHVKTYNILINLKFYLLIFCIIFYTKLFYIVVKRIYNLPSAFQSIFSILIEYLYIILAKGTV